MASVANFGQPTPILRSFDEAKARDFYVTFLGFEITFEHRFGPDMPLYLGLRRGACELHLSEHHGDTTPGTRLRIAVDDVDALAGELAGRPGHGAKPGEPQDQTWGERELAVTDPFGNRLTFWTRSS